MIKKFRDDEYILEHHCDQMLKYTFLIEDPFDKTYNPGRAVKIGDKLEGEYDNMFQNALENLIKTGAFYSDYYEDEYYFEEEEVVPI
jgi:hypothetical protein